MLTAEQQNELKEHLAKAQNPVFYYDNDADGLCSFLLLRRFLGRGKGVAVRSYPDLNASYAQKAVELKADYVFVLDKPVLSPEFVNAFSSLQIPLVWIDHHDIQGTAFSPTPYFYIYNPTRNTGKDKSSEPVTYISYKLCGRPQDLWIAVMGCIADHYLPDFAEEFGKENPEYWGKSIKKPFDAYYMTELGKIAQSLNFGLKDSVTNVIHLQNHLVGCVSPNDVLAETPGNIAFRHKYTQIRKRYDQLFNSAQNNITSKLIFFEYGGDMSISADLSNELSYKYPNHYIAIVYTNGGLSNISLRGKGIKQILERILPKLNNATGGGHNDAVGARVSHTDLAVFKEFLEKEVNNES